MRVLPPSRKIQFRPPCSKVCVADLELVSNSYKPPGISKRHNPFLSFSAISLGCQQLYAEVWLSDSDQLFFSL